MHLFRSTHEIRLAGAMFKIHAKTCNVAATYYSAAHGTCHVNLLEETHCNRWDSGEAHLYEVFASW